MKTLLSAAFLAMLAVQTVPQSNSGIVQGVVTRAGSQEPLPFVQVVLTQGMVSAGLTGRAVAFGNALGAKSGLPIQAAVEEPLKMVTDATGRFTFNGIAPGKYTVLAKRDGYFADMDGGMQVAGATKSITVTDQQKVAPVALSLIPGGVIRGTVRNPNGELVSEYTVTAYRVAYVGGHATLISELTTKTDDRGEYSISWLPPGDYYLAALGPNPLRIPRDTRDRTFYPSSADVQLAKPVAVNTGGVITGIDIAVQVLPNVTISGRVLHLDSKFDPATNLPFSFFLVPRDRGVLSEPQGSIRNQASDQSDGRFEFHGILPGSYDLVVNGATKAGGSTDQSQPVPSRTSYELAMAANSGSIALESRPKFSGRTSVDVGNKDVTDITVTLYPTVAVKGKVTMEGTTTPFSFPSFTVSLQDIYRDGTPANYRAKFDASASFVIPDVPVGAYRIGGLSSDAFYLPDDLYVADIRQGGRSVYDSGIVVGPEAPGEIEVIVRTNGGSMAVTVVDASQKPIGGSTIALVPRDSRRQNLALYRFAVIGTSDVHFVFRGVAPGEYKIFAWESLPRGSAYQDAATLAKVETRGQPVTVAPGVSTASQVRVISK